MHTDITCKAYLKHSETEWRESSMD